jgi:hypothetical protein
MTVSARASSRSQSLSPELEQFSGLGAWSAHVGVTYEAPPDGTQRHSERERAELAVSIARQNLDAARLRVIANLENVGGDGRHEAGLPTTLTGTEIRAPAKEVIARSTKSPSTSPPVPIPSTQRYR